MKLYLVKRDGLSDPIVVGIFTSLEKADKAVQEWCRESDNREWEHFGPSTDGEWLSVYRTARYGHVIFIEEVDANKFKFEGIGYYCGN